MKITKELLEDILGECGTLKVIANDDNKDTKYVSLEEFILPTNKHEYVAEFIAMAFLWAGTDEGQDFWLTIHDLLNELED